MAVDWVDRAVEAIAGRLQPCGAEEVGLLELLGRVPAEDIAAPRDLPSADTSLMDGYAVRSADLVRAAPGAPVELRMAAELKAGDAPGAPLAVGECIKVATGACLPPQSDAVVVYERAEERCGSVVFREAPTSWRFVRRRGGLYKAGQIAARRGIPLDPGGVAMLASFGLERANAFRRPHLSVIATGDELAMPGAKLRHGQVYASNLYLIAAMAQNCGAEAARLGVARDDADEIAGEIASALGSDMVVMTGGTASGPRDLSREALAAAGAEIILSGLEARPCDKFCAAILGGKPVFSLPGRPEAAQVNFYLFAAPALRKLAGFSNYKNKKIRGVYRGERLGGSPVERFLLAEAWPESGRIMARLRGAGDDRPAARSALLVCPAAGPGLCIEDGSEVDLISAG